ncbi:MAG TPA: hypothetical protein VK399_15040 [Longimicrobiaceae bacterium]|nr:hypothetical protein [Longimicrobiaceae bacterium]
MSLEAESLTFDVKLFPPLKRECVVGEQVGNLDERLSPLEIATPIRVLVFASLKVGHMERRGNSCLLRSTRQASSNRSHFSADDTNPETKSDAPAWVSEELPVA